MLKSLEFELVLKNYVIGPENWSTNEFLGWLEGRTHGFEFQSICWKNSLWITLIIIILAFGNVKKKEDHQW